MNIRIALILLLFVCNLDCFARTINEALDIAMQKSYDFEKYKYAKSMAKHDLAKEYLAFTPNVSYNVRREDYSMDYSTINLGSRDFVSNNKSFLVDQNLSLHKMVPAAMSAKNKYEGQVHSFKEEEKDAKMKFIKVFLDVYKYKKIIPLLDNIQEYLTKQIEIGKVKLDHGHINESDYINLQYKLSEIMTEKIKAESEFEIAKNLYTAFIGSPNEEQKPVHNLSKKLAFKTFEDYLERVLQKNSKLKSKNSAVKSAQMDNIKSSADLLPDVKFNFSKNTYEKLWYMAGFPDLNQTIVKLEVNIPIYDSGQKLANASKAIQAVKLAKVDKFMSYDDVYKDAVETWQARDVYRIMYENYQKLLVAMSQKTNASKIKYDSKVGSLGTLLDASIEKSNIEIKMINSQCQSIMYDYKMLFLLQ